jgi:hypothetical protein
VDGTHRLFTMPYELLEEGGGAGGAGGAGDAGGAGGAGGTDGAGGAGGAGGGTGGGGGAHSTMWQLSIALPDEATAAALCGAGGAALLAEAVRRTAAWHAPVPQMLAATAAASVLGCCPATLQPCNPATRRAQACSPVPSTPQPRALHP